jgi:hypothetical protein
MAQRERARFFGGAGSGETDEHLFFSKLTGLRANKQDKRVRVRVFVCVCVCVCVFRKVQVTNICSNYSIIDRLAP